MTKIEKEYNIIIYKNYLHSLMYRNEFGDKYGDTEEIIKMYEKKLKLKKDVEDKKYTNKQ